VLHTLLFLVLCFAQLGASERERPAIGLALSAGGARGLAHVGVLMALEERGIPIDMIAGTSMGALVGGLYAAGFSPGELRQLLGSTRWWDFLLYDRPQDSPPDAPAVVEVEVKGLHPVLPLGLLRGQAIAERLFWLTAEACAAARCDFDSLRVPYRAVAVDLYSGQQVALSRGDLATAIRASIAVPSLFPPVPLGQQLLVDGGVRDYLPVDVCREMGAEIVIAIDAYGIEERAHDMRDLFAVGKRVTDLWMEKTRCLTAAQPDLLVRVDLKSYSELDYHKAREIIAAGYRAMIAHVDSVGVLLAARASSSEQRRFREARGCASRGFSWVKVTGEGRLTEGQLLAAMKLGGAHPVSATQIVSGVRRLYDVGVFTCVCPTVAVADQQGPGVEIKVRESLPTRLLLGLSFRDELGVSGFARITRWPAFLGAMATVQLSAGARKSEARLRLQGLGLSRRRLLPSFTIVASREWPWRYQSGQRIGSVLIRTLAGELSACKELGRHAKLSIGAGVEEVRFREGDGSIRHERNYLLALRFFGGGSQREQLPVSGARLRLLAVSSLPVFGASEFATVRVDGAVYARRGSHVLSPRLVLQAAKGQVPMYRHIRFGGPETLPGYHRDELWSPQGASLGCVHRFHLATFLWTQFGLFAHASWSGHMEHLPSTFRGGVFLGLVAPTPIGPLSIGWGYAGNKAQSKLYLSLGYEL